MNKTSVTIDRRSLLAAGFGLAALAHAPVLPSREAGTLRPLRLAANENPWGPGPAARAALAALTGEARGPFE